MDHLTIFNIITGLASLGGAIISIWQARNSKSAAKQVQEVKDHLIANKKTSEISGLFVACNNAQRVMEKFGPGSVPSNLIGITPSKEAQDVQEFYAILKQNRELFGQSERNKADSYCEKLNSSLDEFALSQNENDLRKYGKDLFLVLVEISSEIKSLMDNKIERTN